MTSAFADVLLRDDEEVFRAPLLVKGELVYAAPIARSALEEARRTAGRAAFRAGEAQVVAAPCLDPGTSKPTGRLRYVVLARPDPSRLVESDVAELSRSLFALPFRDVLEFLSALRAVLADGRREVARTLRALPPPGAFAPGIAGLLAEVLPAFLDLASLAEAVDEELGSPAVPGRRYLDEWVPAGASHPGMMARLGARLDAEPRAVTPFVPLVRAVPTRQLHVTAGNSPFVPFLSLLRAILTKGAATVKVASDAIGILPVLAAAMKAAGPDHPVTRHTSIVYWPGGDRGVEDVLFSPGSYDRVVVWGGAETLRSVRSRAVHTKVVALAPRWAVSLVGRDGEAALDDAAAAACVDTLVWDQKACTASLVHYVEGDDAHARAYSEALARALARWDELLPSPLPLAVQGQIRLLKRGALARGAWFENGRAPDLRSAVVCSREPFDLALHPMARFVVVRPVDRLEDALAFVGPSVAVAGVFPDAALVALRDRLVAAGVSGVFPLGESERAWPGMPHDGMRVLSELVSWASSGERGPAGADDASRPR